MISIIIPAYNEENYIQKTLSTLGAFLKDDAIEVIVVDNGSSDRTAELCEQFEWVKMVRLGCRTTVAEARNAGVNQSTYNCLVFIDADILVSEEWFSALYNFAENIHVNEMIVTGNKVSISKIPSWIELSWFACLKSTSVTYINSGNLICSRHLFNLIGGFDQRLKTGEDVDFCERAKKNGALIKTDSRFFVNHEGYPKTLKAFIARERWHGIGDTQTLEKFVTSKVAMVSLLVALLSGAFLIFVGLGFYSFAFSAFLILCTINLMVLIKRLAIKSMPQLFYSMILNYLYLIARFTSIFSHKQNRLR
jgi:glycosyltransferase involved in cell wall biosynthesis